MNYMTAVNLALAGLLIWSNEVKAEDNVLKYRGSLAWYTYVTSQIIETDSPVNPENKILSLETKSGTLDLRPNVRIDGGAFQLIARPRLKTSSARRKVAKLEGDEHPESTATWLEAYGVMNASDQVIVSYGLQNYQWGAAESINPSNRIFHENVDSKGLLSASAGRHIARANISWTKNLTTVLMSETEENKDIPAFRAEEVFESRALMKHEINWNSGSDYLGLVYGASETGSPWTGEYVNLTLFEGLSIYGDASHQKNSEAWYPVIEDSSIAGQKVVRMKQVKAHDDKIYSLAVGGFRYSFEGGSDLRFEYISNSAGWSMDDNINAKAALDTTRQLQLPDYKTNLARVLKPGLEYRGTKYGMVSLRVPDCLNVKDLTVYGRYMRSIQDLSDSAYGSVEYGFGTASTLLLSGFASRGAPESDLRGVIASSVSAGLRQDF